MRIAYMFSGLGSLSGKTNGILTQALTWACELRKIGVEVDLISPWDGYDFSACDIVHFFSYGAAQEVGFAQLKNKFNVRIAISPIIDTNRSAWKSRMASMLHFPMLHSYSLMGSLRASRQWVDGWFVRSEYEGEHISHALNIPTDKIFKVMLSLDTFGKKIDPVVINDRMKENDDWGEQNGRKYLLELAASVPSTPNVEQYANIVREKYYLRDVIQASTKTIEEARAAGDDATEVIDAAEKRIYDIRSGRSIKNEPKRISDIRRSRASI